MEGHILRFWGTQFGHKKWVFFKPLNPCTLGETDFGPSKYRLKYSPAVLKPVLGSSWLLKNKVIPAPKGLQTWTREHHFARNVRYNLHNSVWFECSSVFTLLPVENTVADSLVCRFSLRKYVFSIENLKIFQF